MIYLHENDVIGVGLHRKCFKHPGRKDLCIKIIYNNAEEAYKEVAREVGYYRFLEKRLVDWRCLPKFYGEVETNLGVGYLYERIVDFDGEPSSTMEKKYPLESVELFCDEIVSLVEDLKKYLWTNRIVTMTLKPYNILVRRLESGEVAPVICDNIGTASFIPLEKFFPWFCHKKQERLFKRFDSIPLIKQAYSCAKPKGARR